MNYTLHQLQVFLKVCELRSITKAAEALHLSQPAVSIQLKNLQDQFQIPLTEVVGRQLYVTDFGKEIEVAASAILDQVYAINYKTLAYKGQLSGRIKIAVVSTGKYVMPYLLADFLAQNSGIELMMDVTNKALVVESLAHNTVDFALVSTLPAHLQTHSLPLLTNSLYLIAAPKLAENLMQNNLSFETTQLIYREAGSATRLAMEQFLKSSGIGNPKKITLTSNEAVKQAVMAGLGVSVMPLIGIKNELQNKQLQIVPMLGLPIHTQWQLVHMAGKSLSPAAKGLADYILNQKEQLINQHFGWVSQYEN